VIVIGITIIATVTAIQKTGVTILVIAIRIIATNVRAMTAMAIASIRTAIMWTGTGITPTTAVAANPQASSAAAHHPCAAA
jgi:hypothetical protein